MEATEVQDCRVLSIPEAARYLGVSAPSVRRFLLNGELPFVILGNRRRIPVRALKRFLDESAKMTETKKE
jgi:excisionase family DNA binding protein